jgi:HNH endonuclease
VGVRGRLEAGSVLVRALEMARDALYRRSRGIGTEPPDEPPTHEQQQADALSLVAETALGQGFESRSGIERYQVVVHVDAPVLADPNQPGRSALECDATRVVMRHAQGHHIHHWSNGGPTRLDNLALLCQRHHRAVHEEGYQVERDAAGTLCFKTPAGRPIPEVPAPPAVSPDAGRALGAEHRARGLAIGPRTACPSWLGERLDLDWAIGVLHPAANPV